MKLAIVDLGCGNVASVDLAFRRLDMEPMITCDPGAVASADRVVLPGVGAAGYAMTRIHELGLFDTLSALTQPALGICLGMQLLFDVSDEGGVDCLGLIPGQVSKLRPAPALPVPHMGWSQVTTDRPVPGMDSGAYFYFAHSYYCEDGPATAATFTYGRDLPAIVREQNWTGVQFHPERSGEAGARFLQAFAA